MYVSELLDFEGKLMTHIKSIVKLLSALYLAILLVGCGGGAGGESSSALSSVTASAGDDLFDVNESTPSVASVDGAVTLSWLPPTENTDGSTLTDLSGYKIYYGTSSDTLTSTISLNNAGISSYVVEGLTAGTAYYFAVSAVNSSDIQSGLSNIANKNVTS